MKTRIEILPDIKDQIDFFQAVPEYDTAMYCHKKMKTNEENSLELLKSVLPVLEAQEDFSNDALFETLKSYLPEKIVKKAGYVMWPIRTAISGKQNTPGGATEIMDDTWQRGVHCTESRKAIEKLSKRGNTWGRMRHRNEAVTHGGRTMHGAGRSRIWENTIRLPDERQYLIRALQSKTRRNSGHYFYQGMLPER